MAYPTFAELARRLVTPYEAADPEMDRQLRKVNKAFRNLVDELSEVVPPGPEATHAAREIHRAAWSVMTAVTLSNRRD